MNFYCFNKKTNFETAWKVSIFRVILVRIFPHSDWVRTRITPNKDTFYAVWLTAEVFINPLIALSESTLTVTKIATNILYVWQWDITYFSSTDWLTPDFLLTLPCCNSPQKCTSVKYKKRQKAGFPIVT